MRSGGGFDLQSCSGRVVTLAFSVESQIRFFEWSRSCVGLIHVCGEIMLDFVNPCIWWCMTSMYVPAILGWKPPHEDFLFAGSRPFEKCLGMVKRVCKGFEAGTFLKLALQPLGFWDVCASRVLSKSMPLSAEIAQYKHVWTTEFCTFAMHFVVLALSSLIHMVHHCAKPSIACFWWFWWAPFWGSPINEAMWNRQTGALECEFAELGPGLVIPCREKKSFWKA